MPDLLPVTIDDMIAEVSRECRKRREVYGRAVHDGRMNRRKADRQIDVMDAVLVHLEQAKAAREGIRNED
jgi:hypothetical protein